MAATLVPSGMTRAQEGPPQTATPAIAAPLVRLPFPQEDGSLTPYTFELGYSLMTLVYDTLLWRDVDGVPQPWLADKVETSPDGRRVTVRLRDNARWQDGPPVTSADVAFTFAYVASHPHPRFTAEVSGVERVDTPDPLTAVITLRDPAPGFRDQPLADLPILPKHIWQGLPKSRSAPDGLAVGSGPYRLVEHVDGQRYRFEANAEYFRGKPAVDVIEVPILRTADETVKALERREVDVIPASLPEDVARRADTLAVKVREGPSYVGTVLLFNLRAPPFDRPEVRQAVAKALDLGRIARAVGKAVPANQGYLHPQSPFATKEMLYRTDATAARTVLKTLPTPIIVLAPDNDPVKAEAARLVTQALKGAGAAAEMNKVSKDDLDRAIGVDGAPPTFQAAVSVIPALASYDPVFLSRIFGSDPATSPFNYTGYKSPAFDDAARRSSTALDPAERTASTAEALRVLATDAPAVPLFFADGAFAYRPAIYDGWTFVKGAGIFDKRSFVEPRSDAQQPPPTSARPGTAGPSGPEDKGGLSVAGYVAIGVLGLAVVLALSLVAGRRGRS